MYLVRRYKGYIQEGGGVGAGCTPHRSRADMYRQCATVVTHSCVCVSKQHIHKCYRGLADEVNPPASLPKGTYLPYIYASYIQ